MVMGDMVVGVVFLSFAMVGFWFPSLAQGTFYLEESVGPDA